MRSDDVNGSLSAAVALVRIRKEVQAADTQKSLLDIQIGHWFARTKTLNLAEIEC
jgi:hypothetical protein